MTSHPYRSTRQSYSSPLAISSFDAEGLKESEQHVISNYFQPPGRVLDLGCGTGRTSRQLEKMGYSTVAIDYSWLMVKNAAQKTNTALQYIHMDASALGFKDSSFDYCLFSFNGIDYLFPDKRRKEALSEIRRVLKPGGICAFSSHNAWFIPNNPARILHLLKSFIRLKIYPYRWNYQNFGRLLERAVTIREETTELIQAGFSDIKVYSQWSQSKFWINFIDPYPTYICTKPFSDI